MSYYIAVKKYNGRESLIKGIPEESDAVKKAEELAKLPKMAFVGVWAEGNEDEDDVDNAIFYTEKE